MQFIHTPHSLASKGHYSPAVIHDKLVYVSGQLPIDYEAGQTMPLGGIEEQTAQVLKNLHDILTRCGTSREQVLRTTVYIPDVAYWPIVNEIYAAFFGDHKPARTVVPSNALHYGALIEIDAIAVVSLS